MHNPQLALEVEAARENRKYLPGVVLQKNVSALSDSRQALEKATLILIAIPSAFVRSALTGLRIPENALVVSVTKGLEPGTLLCMSQVIAETLCISADRVLALSGPSFAVEVARGLPTAVVVAGRSEPGLLVQAALATPTFRVYFSSDITGVELGGALKNVVAIGAGMAAGLGLGHNAVAALITRGLAEMTRLATAMGAQSRTMAGLAGLGDLVLTCTGDLSRNRQLGIALSRTPSASEVLLHSTATTEGVKTAAVAVSLGRRLQVEMPIAEQVHAVLENGRSPAEAIRHLMDRSLKEE